VRTSLEWSDFTIPESSPPVRLARLRQEADGGIWWLVRFPAGWSRPLPGHYLVEEEFWVLEGELDVSEVRYGPGDRGLVAAGEERRGSASGPGALAVARFGGPARWISSPR
jgi:hypothetical protein